jgi:Ca2+-binding EF-hand superfamily protein
MSSDTFKMEPTEYRDALGDDKLEFVELDTNDDFKTKICLPYFKDIYKDLQSRSDNPKKGINKVSLLDYASLPGVLGERLFQVMDSNKDDYLDQREFLIGLFRLYCSSFDEKVEFIFEIYDFDGDGFITKNDISTVMASMPVINFKNIQQDHEREGKFSREGGGLDSFDQRVESLEDMNKILQLCFEGKNQIDTEEFKKINENISSDTVLSVLNLFRERLPCSENFWRYKRNYDMHVNMSSNPSNADTASVTSGGRATKTKRIASPKMRHVRALSPYSRW